MTTTVIVKARAHGATVQTNGETTEVAPNSEHSFHIEEGSQSFSVTQPDAAPTRADELMSEEVPGRAQNDELLGQGGAGKRKASPPTGNESGADETAARS